LPNGFSRTCTTTTPRSPLAQRIGDSENGALFKEMSTKLVAHAKVEQEVLYTAWKRA
jgi:hypothetical protein